MRHYLSSLALALICASGFSAEVPQDFASRAEGGELSFDFTLAFEYYTSLRNPSYKKGSEVYQAFEFDSTNASLYAGSEITSVNITSGTYKDTKTNTIKNVTIFLSEDLEKEPFYTQNAKLGDEGATMYKIDLDTPYQITEGKSVVIGYYFRLTSDDVNYISVDGVYHENIEGGWIGNKVGNGNIVWSNISGSYGNLCMGCTITGSNLPENGVALLSLSGTEYAEPGLAFPYIMYFQNTASNDVTSMEITYSVGSGTPKTETVNLSSPMSYNERKGLRFNNLVCTAPGVNVPVKFEIKKVNGKDNIAADKSRLSYINCFKAADGFKRIHLMEEATGTWCKWCPSGMVMMDNIQKNYPDSYALVAIHGQDEMQVSSTAPVLNLFGGDYPLAMADRATFMYPQNSNINTLLKEYTDYYKDVPSFLGITTLSGVKDAEGNLKVNTGVQFALDVPNADRYRLSYYITESGVGPYEQNNSEYYGGGYGEMGGWGSKPAFVTMLFSDVARLLEGGINGLSGSIPVSPEKGKEYMYEAVLPLTTVTKDNVNLIAFVIDNADGHVVNVAQKTIDLTSSGVKEINSDGNYIVKALQGKVEVDGQFNTAKVFSISGENMGSISQEGEISLSGGIYIVVVDGKAHKVLVR
ncbi:MAG: hypothetical protein K2K97_05425 [Muribaculaceae bacterium]|nr:hypothetical protein [Muribaculaceae bacterium]